MAAGAALFELVPRGGHLVIGATSYNTMLALAEEHRARGDLRVTRVDAADTDGVRAALADADWLHVESPTSFPLIEVADLPAVCAAAREAGVRVSVEHVRDAPAAEPLDAGADVVMHSATKYLAGHSDVLLGVLVTRDAGLLDRLRTHRTLTGAIPGPFETWLALRGVRTLGVRLERAQRTASALAERLASHPAVTRVRYPGLPSDPGHAVAASTMRGFGAMLAIELQDAAAADALTRAVRLWVPATSLGGVESLVERRRRIPSEPETVPGGAGAAVGGPGRRRRPLGRPGAGARSVTFRPVRRNPRWVWILPHRNARGGRADTTARSNTAAETQPTTPSTPVPRATAARFSKRCAL